MSEKRLIELRTRWDLDEFLRILAEESVSKAREDLRSGIYSSEEDVLQHATSREKKNQSRLEKRLDRLSDKGRSKKPTEEADEDIFKTITKGDGEDNASGSPLGSLEKKPERGVKSDDDSVDADDESSGRVGGEDRVTFTMIRDKLNTIRSGRSLRDKDIRAELKNYIMRLDPDERIALHAFLDGIGQILTAGLSAKDVKEPSEDPYDIKMSRYTKGTKDEDEEEPKGAVRRPVIRSKQRRSIEDTTAPIKVGQKQTTETIRRKIRDLMS